jgi:peptidoglycan/xylan/chitin deacetylase (PgdA/CDA1 family)
MNFKNIAASLVVILFLTAINNAQTIDTPYEVGTWQGFRSGAVSFTFDDNCPNQLSVMMPIFNQYGFKMTFFAVINWGPNWSALQAAALNGHEIGSHTQSHPSLNTLTDEQQVTELKNSQDIINSHIQGQKCLTIAYPNCVLGNSSICKQYYIAARGCSGAIVPKTPPDFMNISSFVCGSQSSFLQRTSGFIDEANAAASSNGWVVFLMHAIDNEPGYSPTSSTEIKGALDYLSQNTSKFWVSTFSDVARYILERNYISVKEVSANDSVITCSVTDTLDNSIYNLPVTIRRLLPTGWSSAGVSQSGKTISSQIVNVNAKNYIMFDVIPDSGDVQLTKENVTDVRGDLISPISSPFLMQNYPNPFNPSTTISFSLSSKSFVSLRVFDLTGQEVAILANEQLPSGTYRLQWNAEGRPSGAYFYHLQAGIFGETKKLLLIK